jgi:(p)ppGpp synthase/HD superfamily hydrolase
MWKLLLKSARFARKAHEGQLRAHGAPYFSHPAAVARLLWEKGEREPALLAAAYLHDTMEDCGASEAELAALAGPAAAALVAACSKRPGEPKRAYYERVKAHGAAAMALKMADREHNNSELHLAPPEKAYLRGKAAAKTALMLEVFGK